MKVDPGILVHGFKRKKKHMNEKDGQEDYHDIN